MLFNSVPFLVFLPLFLSLYFGTSGRLRLRVCLGASYLFYGWWDWRFLGLILLSTLIDYFVGLQLGQTDEPRRRRLLLIVSLVANLGVLGLFKYLNFFVYSFESMMAWWGIAVSSRTLEIILPVGISFYTFQTMSYTIDVYRRRLDVEPSFLRFATFVAFFPQLVAGPIVRAGDVLPQLQSDRRYDQRAFVDGVGLALWGFFKKVVVADSLAPLVDPRFSNPEWHGSLSLTVGLVFYAFQIYCDFSGYSDIAIGLARMMGFNFGVNFRTPYFSRSFSEFWERWHISLSSWLRDYLYISLGGNRRGKVRTYVNLCLTMLLGGLWHGANWTFVVWGALHGSYLVLQRVLGPLYRRLEGVFRIPRFLSSAFLMALVFALTCFAWVFFRSPSFSQAFTFLARLASFEDFRLASLTPRFLIVKGVLLIMALVGFEVLALRTRIVPWLRASARARVVAYSSALWVIALLGTFSGQQFIYFQF